MLPMANGKKWVSAAAALGLVCLLAGVSSAASSKSKPMIPVGISIEATDAKMKPQNIKPGDVVEFRISAQAVRGADEVSIEITLQGGAELVSGDLKWTGKLSRTERKQIVISVRAPSTGTGKVMASITALRNGQTVMSKQATYALGSEEMSVKGKPAHGMQKDAKGRSVVEY